MTQVIKDQIAINALLDFTQILPIASPVVLQLVYTASNVAHLQLALLVLLAIKLLYAQPAPLDIIKFLHRLLNVRHAYSLQPNASSALMLLTAHSALLDILGHCAIPASLGTQELIVILASLATTK